MKYEKVHFQVQDMRIKMRQLMDENERLLKLYKQQQQPNKVAKTPRRDHKANEREQWERNLQNLKKNITPLTESLSGEDFTARELLEPELCEEWVIDGSKLKKKKKVKCSLPQIN